MTAKYGLLVTNFGGIDLDEFREMIAINAYYRAEKRNFAAGHDLNDWLEAEREILCRYVVNFPLDKIRSHNAAFS